MAFSKNWKQLVVSKGEPFQIEYLDRKFGGRPVVKFEVTDEGVVRVNGRVMDGSQNFTGDVVVDGDISADNLDLAEDLTVLGDTDLSAGAVTLPADTVTAAQLDTVLTAQIPLTATFTVGALVGDGRTVTVQIKDAAGTNMAVAGRYSAWLSDTAKGTPIGQVTTGLTTTVPAGTVALIKLANMDYDIISTALGAFQVLVTDTNGTQTRYLNVEVAGVVYASGAIVTT